MLQEAGGYVPKPCSPLDETRTDQMVELGTTWLKEKPKMMENPYQHFFVSLLTSIQNCPRTRPGGGVLKRGFHHWGWWKFLWQPIGSCWRRWQELEAQHLTGYNWYSCSKISTGAQYSSPSKRLFLHGYPLPKLTRCCRIRPLTGDFAWPDHRFRRAIGSQGGGKGPTETVGTRFDGMGEKWEMWWYRVS